ncbi:type 1 glutamine amidotransferase [Acetivibrio clariflavus]|uniref:Lipid II isoglutaminyl synthase (glutamine-hydrolyzing) subunit GatD n=1 Tax=Acetivibrio clariflavus (strain DSM 19732 / NBRC 101661 / EBR45) TaxID=720554 RepID=G8LX94_ACECE|nr:glutamine amidotransferase [Acetivibrio clariflavus]AEV68785.1 putative glutamine amidotransferase [Acetivibrio clariflavus DSM 19732]HOQ01505.1 glutamine amidotransferase [Acetivibrio clariflavus]
MYELNICHLYPDLLNLYGDRGNIIAIARRSQWRGIKVNISDISIGDKFDAEKYDIIFLGGGQDFEQEVIQDDVLNKKGNEIRNAIENDKIFLAICGGYQLLGNYYKTWDGKEIEFLRALDLWTIGSKKRMIGNFCFECDFLKTDSFDGRVVGFENHSGRTYLGPSVRPLGKIVKGYGNNGEDGFEGAIYKNVYCSYSHGSLLPKNPHLTDYLITLALKQKYKDFDSLEKLNDEFEELARKTMIQRIVG